MILIDNGNCDRLIFAQSEKQSRVSTLTIAQSGVYWFDIDTERKDGAEVSLQPYAGGLSGGYLFTRFLFVAGLKEIHVTEVYDN